MREKRFEHLLQIRISSDDQRRLERAGQKLDLNIADLVRLSLRVGLPHLLSKLPPVDRRVSE